MLGSHRGLICLLTGAVWQASLVPAEAGPLLDWLFHRRERQTTYYAPAPVAPVAPVSVGYAPTAVGVAPATTAPVSVGPASCQQTVVQYMPETAYRTVWSPVPVTQYQTTTNINPQNGLPITCTRPCVTYTYQAQRVPYTTYRPVYAQVPVTLPASYYGTTAGYAPATAVTAGYAPTAYTSAIAPATYAPATYAPSPVTYGYGATTAAYAAPATVGCNSCSGAVGTTGYAATTYPLDASAVAPATYEAPSYSSSGTVSGDVPGATPWMPRNQASAGGLIPQAAPEATYGGSGAANTRPQLSPQDPNRIEQQGGVTPDRGGAFDNYGTPPANVNPPANAGAFNSTRFNPNNNSSLRPGYQDQRYGGYASPAPADSQYRWNQSWPSTNTPTIAPPVNNAAPAANGGYATGGYATGNSGYGAAGYGAAGGAAPAAGTLGTSLDTGVVGSGVAGSAPAAGGPALSNPSAAPVAPSNPTDPWWRRPLSNSQAPSTAPAGGATGTSPTSGMAPTSESMRFQVQPLPDSPRNRDADWKTPGVPSLLDPNDLTASRQLPASNSPVAAAIPRSTPIRWTASHSGTENVGSRAVGSLGATAAGIGGGVANTRAAAGPTGSELAPAPRPSLGPARLELPPTGSRTELAPAPVANEDSGWRPGR